MAQVCVAFALHARSAHALEGSGGMLPQEKFGFLESVSGGIKVRYLSSR